MPIDLIGSAKLVLNGDIPVGGLSAPQIRNIVEIGLYLSGREASSCSKIAERDVQYNKVEGTRELCVGAQGAQYQ